MTKNNFRELVDKIRGEVKVEELAKELGFYIEGKGEQKRILCPFHDDTKPSLVLYEDHYHCYTCDAHGDMFDLVKHEKKLSFKEAVEWLANYKGIPVPKYTIKSRKLKGEFNNSLEFGYALYKKKANKNALKEWCIERAVDFELINNSGIISIDRNTITSRLEQETGIYSKLEWEALSNAGLVRFVRPAKFKEDGRTFLDLDSLPKDVFWYKAIIFPIYDEYGKLQGLAAREKEDEKYQGPKYRYTRGFKRSQNLYGIDKIFEKAREYVKDKKTK
jgi:DNA primase